MVRSIEFRVVVPQLEFVVGRPLENLEILTRAIKKMESEVTTLVVFPELALVGYYTRDAIYYMEDEVELALEKLEELVMSMDKLFIGIGHPEYTEDAIYNSYTIFGPKGRMGTWRKMHLPTFTMFEEGLYYRPAEHVEPPIAIGNLKVGVAICYDAFFPEIPRILRLKGAEILLVPSAAPIQSRALWKNILPARAIENGVYVVYSNHVGYKDAYFFFGESRIIDPLGNVVVQAKFGEEDTVEAQIRRPSIYKANVRWRPTLRDLKRRVLKQLSEL